MIRRRCIVRACDVISHPHLASLSAQGMRVLSDLLESGLPLRDAVAKVGVRVVSWCWEAVMLVLVVVGLEYGEAGRQGLLGVA